MGEALNKAKDERRYLQKEYIIRYLNGDESVKEALIESFFPLAETLARRYLSTCYYYGIDIKDLYSEGYMSIAKALGRIKPCSMGEIITYITRTIEGDIKHYIRDHLSPIRFPRCIREISLYIIPKLMKDFMKTSGREPTTKEIVALTGLDEKMVATAMRLRTLIFSIDTKTNDGDTDLNDVISDPLATNEEDIVTQITLRGIISSLDNSERELIAMRYYNNMSQTEVGREFGCTQNTISREERKILEKIRHKLES